MPDQLVIGGFEVDVAKKNIKNLHLTVHPPTGKVRISAPSHMDIETIKAFALTKLDWIKHHHKKMISQARETEREFLERESHFIWGKRYLLKVVTQEKPRQILLSGSTITLFVRPGDDHNKRAKIFEEWCRKELRTVAETMCKKWQAKIGLNLEKIHIQRMKTKWGSCSPEKSSIRLNTELVHKPKMALEFVVVHELLHFIEPRHSRAFFEMMDWHLPNWRVTRQKLNELPLSFSITS